MHFKPFACDVTFGSACRGKNLSLKKKKDFFQEDAKYLCTHTHCSNCSTKVEYNPNGNLKPPPNTAQPARETFADAAKRAAQHLGELQGLSLPLSFRILEKFGGVLSQQSAPPLWPGGTCSPLSPLWQGPSSESLEAETYEKREPSMIGQEKRRTGVT